MQYDSFDIGFITTDEFTNSDILDATYPAVQSRLTADFRAAPAVPIVTGFLGKVRTDSWTVLSVAPDHILVGALHQIVSQRLL